MGAQTHEPTYTGIDKYPGLIATVITIIIGAVFLGALYNSATAGHHDASHAPAAEGDHAPAAAGDHGAEQAPAAAGDGH